MLSVQFSLVAQPCPTLRPHGLHHARLPCPSPTPRAYSNSHPSSWWCHPTISSSIIPFSSRLQSFPASGSFPVSQFFTSGGQSTGISASTSVLPMNILKDWFPLGWTGWISLQSKGLSRVFSSTTVQKHQFFTASFMVQLSHAYMTTGKNQSFDSTYLCQQRDVLLFNMLSRLVIAFLPRSKYLLISWLKSPSAVILEHPKIKTLTVSKFSLSICQEVMGPDAMILVFWMLSYRTTFSLSSLTFIKRLFSSSTLSAIRVVMCIYWYVSRQSWCQFVLHPVWHLAWCTLHIS